MPQPQLPSTSHVPSRWELAAEAIAIKIRWFGLVVGFLLVNFDPLAATQRPILNLILTVGTVFTLFDTYYSLRAKVFLGDYPLLISAMEALFIGWLCYFDRGLESPFRYYYFLSLICCAIRHLPQVTYLTCAMHSSSLGVLYLVDPVGRSVMQFGLTLVILGWVTWASNALAMLLKRVGEHLVQLNTALRENQLKLEERIQERTQQLQEAQAHLLHQEKMAAFGLLAAGIAHEVGNPLTSISTIVQMIQRRPLDEYVQEKLSLVNGQLQRIRTTLRELIEFSRPASTARVYASLPEILEEALGIAKYYNRMGGKILAPNLSPNLPPVLAIRDQLVQVFLNLILNAIDATAEQASRKRQQEILQGDELPFRGTVEIEVLTEDQFLIVTVRDDGCGIPTEHHDQVFRPYFTTKKHGTGLGLFVCRKLIHDHGGTMEMTSKPGTGTAFRIALPWVSPHNQLTSCEVSSEPNA